MCYFYSKKEGGEGGVKRKLKANPADHSAKRQRGDLAGGGAGGGTSSPMVAQGR